MNKIVQRISNCESRCAYNFTYFSSYSSALLILSGMVLILSSDGSIIGGVSSTLIVLGIFIYILEIVFYFGWLVYSLLNKKLANQKLESSFLIMNHLDYIVLLVKQLWTPNQINYRLVFRISWSRNRII
jgi:hypothetical protein